MKPVFKLVNSYNTPSYFENLNGDWIISSSDINKKIMVYFCTINEFYYIELPTLNKINRDLSFKQNIKSGSYDYANFNLITKTLNFRLNSFNEKLIFNDEFLPIYWENSLGAFEMMEFDKFGNMTFIKNHRNNFIKRKYDDKGNMIYFEDSIGNYWDKELMPSIKSNPYFEKQ